MISIYRKKLALAKPCATKSLTSQKSPRTKSYAPMSHQASFPLPNELVDILFRHSEPSPLELIAINDTCKTMRLYVNATLKALVPPDERASKNILRVWVQKFDALPDHEQKILAATAPYLPPPYLFASFDENSWAAHENLAQAIDWASNSQAPEMEECLKEAKKFARLADLPDLDTRDIEQRGYRKTVNINLLRARLKAESGSAEKMEEHICIAEKYAAESDMHIVQTCIVDIRQLLTRDASDA